MDAVATMAVTLDDIDITCMPALDPSRDDSLVKMAGSQGMCKGWELGCRRASKQTAGFKLSRMCIPARAVLVCKHPPAHTSAPYVKWAADRCNDSEL